MTTAIVHIGFGKCGSTAIQRWLADNAAALAGQGIAVRRTDPRPDVVCSNPQLVDLAYSLNGQTMNPRPFTRIIGYKAGDLADQTRATEAFRADHENWIKSHTQPVTVMSNEALADWLVTPDLVRRFDTWLRGLFSKVRYVAYIRRPLAWLISYHGQKRKTGDTAQDLEEFVTARPDTPFRRCLTTWCEAVSHERIDLRLFRERWLSEPGLIEDFSVAIGADLSRATATPVRANLTYDGSSAAGPTRPLPSDTLRATVDQANDAAMDWIAQRFFPTRRASFDAWLTEAPRSAPTASRRWFSFLSGAGR